MRNAFADFGVSEYMGLVAIWIVEREDDDAVVVLVPANRGALAHIQTASTTVAMPMPPPTQSVARPYLPPVRCSS